MLLVIIQDSCTKFGVRAIVDYVIDINHHFIKEGNLNIPNDLQSTFVSIADNSIISKEFAQKIAPVVGLRNRIVHQYEDVDPKLFIASVRKNIGDFDHYIAFILTYIGGLKK